MTFLTLTSSSFVGGPERQMLGLAKHYPGPCRWVFLLFHEGGVQEALRQAVLAEGFEAVVLERNRPDLPGIVREVAGQLRAQRADVLCCYGGYKPDLVGLLAARRADVPAVAVAGGWTSHTLKVRLYEALDRWALRRMDRVVCVSHGLAQRLRSTGVPGRLLTVIYNAVEPERLGRPDPLTREELLGRFAGPVSAVVGTVGRLSPEKGFGMLVEAAALVRREMPEVGFIHFGDGPLRPEIERRIAQLNLSGRFVLAGFREDVGRFMHHWDLSVLPSFTEGLPNVVLEAYSAGVPVVATAVGGTPEIVTDGVDGYLVPPGNPVALAGRILEALRLDSAARKAMGERGRQRVREQFTFEAKAKAFRRLFEELAARPSHPEEPAAASRRAGR
jgi:glycosyltransferase involved in cell wall biosynthesis